MALALGRLGYLVIYKTPYPALDEVVGVRNIAPNVYLTSDEHFDFIEGAVHSTYSTTANHPSGWTEGWGFSSCTIYEYVDHIDPKISGSEENVRRLLAGKRSAFDEGGYDFVITSARQLEDEAVEAVGRDKVILVPNGVDVWHYRNPAHERFHLPEELLEFRNEYENVVGYFGAIAPWLWYEEITKLVNRRPDLGFVFIGPDYAADAVAKLPKTRNVLWLDQVSYDALPAYAIQFDVCFIPFEPDEIAHTTSPLKLFEYFALEKPVVVTSQMHECTAFDVVFSGDDASSLSTAIDEAIGSKSDPAFKAELARLADENSWDNRARLLERVFLKASETSPTNLRLLERVFLKASETSPTNLRRNNPEGSCDYRKVISPAIIDEHHSDYYLSLAADECNDYMSRKPTWVTRDQGMLSLNYTMGLVKHFKPRSMLEIGVSAGLTSGAMLVASHTYDSESTVYGIDVADRVYFAPEKRIGNLIDEAYPELRHHLTLFIGKTCINIPDLLVEQIDFVYIDSLHSHPWPTLDALNSLTRIAKGGIIAIDGVRFGAPGHNGSVYLYHLYQGDKQTCDGVQTGAISVNDKQSLLEHCYKVLELWWEVNVGEVVLTKTEANIKACFGVTAAERFREICKARHEHLVRFERIYNLAATIQWEYVEEMKRLARLENAVEVSR